MNTNSAPNLQRIRVTLDLEVDGNSFNPHQIDYHSLFDINEEYEKLTVLSRICQSMLILYGSNLMRIV